jgi:hypothetical protein
VNYSPAFKWTVGLLIPLTLAWKISLGADNPNEFTDRIMDFLERRGFVVTIEEGLGLIRATRGECRMLVVERGGTGWSRQLVASSGEAADRNFIVFRGVIYEGDPTWLTAITSIYFRMLRRLGFGRSALIVGVAAPPACDAKRLAWDEL